LFSSKIENSGHSRNSRQLRKIELKTTMKKRTYKYKTIVLE
jgi:hypothetical protein